MDFGRGFSNQEEKELTTQGGSWIQEKDLRTQRSDWVPVTPSKPIATKARLNSVDGERKWGEQFEMLFQQGTTPVPVSNGRAGYGNSVEQNGVNNNREEAISANRQPTWGQQVHILCQGTQVSNGRSPGYRNSVNSMEQNGGVNNNREEAISADGLRKWGEQYEILCQGNQVSNGSRGYYNTANSVDQMGGVNNTREEVYAANNGGCNSYQRALNYEAERRGHIPNGQLLSTINSAAQALVASTSRNQRSDNAIHSQIPNGQLLAPINSTSQGQMAFTCRGQRNDNAAYSQIDNGQLLAAMNLASQASVASASESQRNGYAVLSQIPGGNLLATINSTSQAPGASESGSQRNGNAILSQIPSGNLLATINSASQASVASTSGSQRYDNGRHSQIYSGNQHFNAASELPRDQDYSTGSNWRKYNNYPPQMPQDGFPVPYRPASTYDRNYGPRSMSDAVSSKNISFQFAPVTPEKDRNVQQQNGTPINLQCQKRSNQEMPNVINLDPEEPLEQPVVDQENGFDLNKTPQPQQKPRRKKYTPRVVREGKPKRAPKPKENLTPKRKYVRKNGINSSSTPSAEVEEIINPTDISPAKSCKRVLNFDLSRHEKDERQGASSSSSRVAFNFDTQRQEQNMCNARTDTSTGTRSTFQFAQGLEVEIEHSPAGLAFDLNRSLTQVLDEYMSLPGMNEQMMRKGLFRRNLKDLAREKNEMERRERAPLPNESASNHRTYSATCLNSINNASQRAEQTAWEPKRGNSHNSDEERLRSMNLMGTHYNSLQAYHDAFQPNGNYTSSSDHGLEVSEINKKRKTVNVRDAGMSNTSSSANASQFQQQANSSGTSPHCNNTNGLQILKNGVQDFVQNVYSNSVASVNNSGVQIFPAETLSHKVAVMAAIKPQGSQFLLNFKQAENRSVRSTQINDLISLPTHAQCNKVPMVPAKTVLRSGGELGFQIFQGPQTYLEAALEERNAKKAKMNRNTKELALVSRASTSTRNEVNLQGQDARRSSVKSRGPAKVARRSLDPIDEICQRLNRIDINSNTITWQEHNAITWQEQNAMVPYGADGNMVPYEGLFDPTKRRRPRARVELDAETDRVWKLLMGKESSGSVDGTDEDKAKWWANERKSFQGRAALFIDQMHRVQGDRTFTKWTGSVLDSIIGVFLTQNVSDHLSSSAFMSMAAHFPLKSTGSNRKRNEVGPVTCIVEHPNDAICQEKVSVESDCDQSSITLHETEHTKEREMSNNIESVASVSGDDSCRESPQSPTEILTMGTGVSSLVQPVDTAAEDLVSSQTSNTSSQVSVETRVESGSSVEVDDGRAPEDIVSSQYSIGSSSPQADERIRSCSGSNSEGEDPTSTTACESNSYKGSATFTELLQMAGSTMWQELCDQGNESLLMNLNSGFDLNGTEFDRRSSSFNIPGLPRIFSTHPKNSPLPTTLQPDVPSVNSSVHVTPDSGVHELGCHEVLGEESRITLSLGQEACNDKQTHTYNQQQRIKTFQHESAPAQMKDEKVQQEHSCLPNVSRETSGVGETTCFLNKEKSAENKISEHNSGEQPYASDKASSSKINSNNSKAKTKQPEKESKKPVDWDHLRKTTCRDGKQRERDYGTRDSLDWEAVRNADVDVIAKTIKERGMNNMLAERIKNFLDRMVRDHGSLDMEWLRDVPPAEAKDYLLSVRGLGLKSVECIRLLTLHHVAFPVDTNVGRIAVRLGWVPLQPLPESLQLHLLEMYPVQETIQKYLWPRLCKLDHMTLYKLHYHMITFGKVFCTKSKPNCNACPLRADCRHFASAFASARLSLPAPEEKGVISNVTITPSQIPVAMPVPRLEEDITTPNQIPIANFNPMLVSRLQENMSSISSFVEMPSSPERPASFVEIPSSPERREVSEPEDRETHIRDIEDAFYENDPEDELPPIPIDLRQLQSKIEEVHGGDFSMALVPFKDVSLPTSKLKNVSRLRTEHQVYELPDSHPLLVGMEERVINEPGVYLLAIWTPGETANSVQPPQRSCGSAADNLCSDETCVSCNATREANSQTVRGTILIPCKTAMRGSFPLNGTYFQVNEVFADHASSLKPIDVPRSWIWNLPRRTVLFGTSIPSIFKGQTLREIQYCFWRGFVCVRGFDQATRAPKPLIARLHFPASRLTGNKTKRSEE
ncbi:hypothetical protein GIB67_034060 [Kingdonia uniflora]|uniref:HhH-GPD domain-containing protein n=1 Tax=Kingdonia uniflora TaxID=39325 RepID=A0A7J7M638_9MAGN|nr:hypothetical protein GIB67_034060 [Kingdonia uniflora]